MAVGLLDSPTLHILPVTAAGLADESRINDCAFDTINFKKFEIPSIHVTLKWNGSKCVRVD
jgi:hypothetical protein